MVKQRPKIEVHKDRLIDAVIEHIGEHIEEEIKIDDLTEIFFLSKFHLCREFKNTPGPTLLTGTSSRKS